jgi:hypothetical protein
MNKQITKIAMMLVLTLGLMAGTAMSQKQDGGGIAPVGIYTGVETSEGTLDSVNSMVWGNTVVMTSYGENETHHLTVSCDYFTNQFNPSGGFATTGGTWSMVRYSAGQFQGTIYGEVIGGTMIVEQLNGQITNRTARLQLGVKGGTGQFKDAGNTIISLEASTETRSHTTRGNTFGSF